MGSYFGYAVVSADINSDGWVEDKMCDMTEEGGRKMNTDNSSCVVIPKISFTHVLYLWTIISNLRLTLNSDWKQM